MLQLSGSLLNRPILSLRTGGLVGNTLGPIINPLNLKIEGFYCHDNFDRKKKMVLLSQDIRDVIAQGIVVNDHESLSDPSELVRLKDTMTINFDIMSKHVVTTSKQKMGKVVDFAVDIDSMYIQKIYVAQSVFRSIARNNYGIDRTQIVEINDKKIIIHDIMPGVPAKAPATA